MQTREEILAKVAEMEGDLHEKIAREVNRLLATGAINMDNMEEYTNDFYLPKMLYTQALRNISNAYAPPDEAGRRLLRRFARS